MEYCNTGMLGINLFPSFHYSKVLLIEQQTGSRLTAVSSEVSAEKQLFHANSVFILGKSGYGYF
jgi:hypothetical protein